MNFAHGEGSARRAGVLVSVEGESLRRHQT
jgi:hypothetical protein